MVVDLTASDAVERLFSQRWRGRDIQQGVPFKHAFGEEQTAFQLKLSFCSLATVTQMTQLQYSPYYCLICKYWENLSLRHLRHSSSSKAHFSLGSKPAVPDFLRSHAPQGSFQILKRLFSEKANSIPHLTLTA
jgi:hypothetical protein